MLKKILFNRKQKIGDNTLEKQPKELKQLQWMLLC